jgi:hypothetical protein
LGRDAADVSVWRVGREEGEVKMTDSKFPVYCSFCGKSNLEALIIAAPAVYICEECVDLCAGIVQDYRNEQDTKTAWMDSEYGSRIFSRTGIVK